MNRKVLGGLVALGVALLLVWLLVLRDRGGTKPVGVADTKVRTGALGSAAVPTPQPAANEPNSGPAPRGQAPRWTTDVDPEGPLRLEGQVVGPDGKGVGGAEVLLSSVPPRTTTSEGDGSFGFDKLVGRSYSLRARTATLIGGPARYKLSETSAPIVIRMTAGATLIVGVVDDAKRPIAGAEVKLGDDDGEHAWKTDVAGKATVTPVRPGFVAITATAAGYAAGGGFTMVGSTNATGELVVTLHKGFAVSGHVVDETGKPIAKAAVELHGMWDFANNEKGTETDAKGAFTIAALGAGRHTLVASDGEHAPGQSAPVTVVDRAVTGVEITLKAGGIVAGTVVDPTGKPVPYATVRVSASATRGAMDAFRQVTADRLGAFEVRGLARVPLQARAESEATASKVVTVDLTKDAAKRDLKLVLEIDGVIAGIVVDDTGAPVPEVQVNAFPDFMGGGGTEDVALAGMSSAITDGDGAFAVRGLPKGPYRLWAARGNTGNEWGQQGVSANVGDKTVRITLAAPGIVKGKLVIDGSSEPPKLAHVQIGLQPTTPITGGSFEIKDVTPGTHDVTFRGSEFAELIKHDIKVAPGKTTDLGTITVIRGRKLVGKVVDGKGAPVAGAKVKVADALFSLDGAEEQLANLEEQQGVRSGITDQAGEFAIIGIGSKATNVGADHPERGRSNAVALPAGSGDPPRIVLTLRGYGSLTGKVTLKGVPQSKVTISVASKAGGAQATFTQTDADGSFAVARVQEGTIVVSAMQQGTVAFRSTSMEVTVVAGKPATVAIEIPVGTIGLTISINPLPSHKVDRAQIFLLKGTVAMSTAKELMDVFVGGAVAGMDWWFGPTKPSPEFKELVAGVYSACAIPITGDLDDPLFAARVGQNLNTLRVYCKQVTVAAAPTKQATILEVPSMTPLPPPPPSP